MLNVATDARQLLSVSASSVPSPPSATGTSTVNASGAAICIPWAIARATRAASRLPLKESGAITIFFIVGNYPILKGSSEEYTKKQAK